MAGLFFGASRHARSDFLISEVNPLSGGSMSRAYGINNSGFVAGESSSPYSNAMQAIRTNDNGTQAVGYNMGGWSSRGLAISDGNVVVGRSDMFTPNGEVSRGFVFSDPNVGMQTLSGLADSRSTVANGVSGGTIVGTVTGSNGLTQAVTWDLQGHPKAIGGLTPGGSSSGLGVNNAGQVTGAAQTAGDGSHAFLYNPGQTVGAPGVMKDLGILTSGGTSQGNAVNNAGEVAGWASTGTSGYHAFAYLGTQMVDIQGSQFLASSSMGLGINDAGWIVGRADEGNGGSFAFLWRDGLGMVDLNSLIDKTQGWDLLSATGINNHGQIVGFGIHNGLTLGFVLNPVLDSDPPSLPEPSSLTLCGMAAASLALGWAARRRMRTRTARGVSGE
jgi:probable HAF family extracellular repeat protein